MAEKKLIDAEPIKQFIVDGLNNPDLKKAFGHDAIEILAEIEFAPTIDAVLVVRCKDCKHYTSSSGCIGIMPGYGFDVKPDDFCSYGERREDNGSRKANGI